MVNILFIFEIYDSTTMQRNSKHPTYLPVFYIELQNCHLLLTNKLLWVQADTRYHIVF